MQQSSKSEEFMWQKGAMDNEEEAWEQQHEGFKKKILKDDLLSPHYVVAPHLHIDFYFKLENLSSPFTLDQF